MTRKDFEAIAECVRNVLPEPRDWDVAHAADYCDNYNGRPGA